MTTMQYMRVFLAHNYNVLRVKFFELLYHVVDQIKKKDFVLQGKGDLLKYRSEELRKNMRVVSGASEAEVTGLPAKRLRDRFFDFIFVQELFTRVGLTGEQLKDSVMYIMPHAYVHFSADYWFMDLTARFNNLKTGKDLLEFLEYATDVKLRTFEHALGEQMYARLYSDILIQDLIDFFDTKEQKETS